MSYYIDQRSQMMSAGGGGVVSGGGAADMLEQSVAGQMQSAGGASMRSSSSSYSASSSSAAAGGGSMQMDQLDAAQAAQMMAAGDGSLKVSQVVKGEMSAKTTYQRSAKGPVSIMECSADGKYIALENTSRKEEVLGGWRISRIIDGAERANFQLPSNFKISGKAKIKIWAQGKRPHDAGHEIEVEPQTFGIGSNITTKLISPQGEERATHVQKT